MAKPHQKKKRKYLTTNKRGSTFWNKEYINAEHLALSTNPSEDLIKFIRWLEREHHYAIPNPNWVVFDVGCGNGRNLIHLAKEYGVHGGGFDISSHAITQGKEASHDLPLAFTLRSLKEPLKKDTDSQNLVLDMMASHVLDQDERIALRDEIDRVLKPDGWLFMKTFLLDEDRNAARMLKEHAADEPGSYIHPNIGILEHVYRESELIAFLEPRFTIHRITRSHQHLRDGRPHKRRSICVYAQVKK